MLIVPQDMNRNAKSVQDMGDPADTGAMLISYMCERIGIDDLGGLDILDLGCGTRFSEAILNRDLPVGSYTGIEVKQNIVDFLHDNVDDSRFAYFQFDIKNLCYNPKGIALSEGLGDEISAALDHKRFDIACMFSVITHQQPDEAHAIFRLLAPHIRPGGHLFFSAFIHEGEPDHKELKPQRPGMQSSFSAVHMAQMLADTGWSVVSRADPAPEGLPIMWSYLCAPV